MPSQHSRAPPSPASPTASNSQSKFPKFLQKPITRDRSKSLNEPSSTNSSPSGSAISTPPETPTASKASRKTHKISVPGKHNSRASVDIRAPEATNTRSLSNEMDEPPVIVEPPPSSPRPRTHSERPHTPANTLYSSTSSTSRIGDLPTRLSGWFSQAFNSSSNDLTLPNIVGQNHAVTSSPTKGKGSALLTAAKHGKGHLDKAMRYLLDSDATPDKCTDPIWLLGVQHPGYEPPPPPSSLSSNSTSSSNRRSSSDSRRRGSPSLRSSTSSVASNDQQLSHSQSTVGKNPAATWPPVFYADYTTRIWLTYRSQFEPIKDQRLADLACEIPAVSMTVGSPSTKRWHWGNDKGWTSDSGWGCMLRTGQSLLANSLLHMHLGREWRLPQYPTHTTDYATYVQIITWFLDSPAPEAPFSVHRMALAGKELGKDVGQWFGPSTAAGAIKQLVDAFPEAQLGVSVASDGTVFQSEVYAASHTGYGSSRHRNQGIWGDRAVLILLGTRLGHDRVNPIYYQTIKTLFTFPQSVGIAGGRPSSSYYFIGSQADNLFYLDPHHARPAIPLRLPSDPMTDYDTSDHRSKSLHRNVRSPVSPSSSIRTGSSTFSHRARNSPSPLQHQFSTSSGGSGSAAPSVRPSRQASVSTTHSQISSPTMSPQMDPREIYSIGSAGEELDAIQEHFISSYSPAELRTFHCDRVRKMPLNGLDPSMLLGFLCKTEQDWIDLRHRLAELAKHHQPIFSVQDEPPNWPSGSDDDMGLESISEPDDMDLDDDDDAEQFFDTRSGSASLSSVSNGAQGKSRSVEDIDTEEDPVDPITPGPHSKFHISELRKGTDDAATKGRTYNQESAVNDDIEDDWIDPSLPTPRSEAAPTLSSQSSSSASSPTPVLSPPVPSMSRSRSGGGTTSKKKHKKQVPVPVPSYPFPVTQRTSEDLSSEERPTRLSGIRPTAVTVTAANANMSEKRMHSARARDGGRTQSGGVKGILTDD